jgi:aspartate ammonia-lyase
MTTKYSGKTRIESDLLGEMEVPVEALYGVQTLRGIINFPISRFHLSDYPLFINGLAMTKLGAAVANHENKFDVAELNEHYAYLESKKEALK